MRWKNEGPLLIRNLLLYVTSIKVWLKDVPSQFFQVFEKILFFISTPIHESMLINELNRSRSSKLFMMGSVAFSIWHSSFKMVFSSEFKSSFLPWRLRKLQRNRYDINTDYHQKNFQIYQKLFEIHRDTGKQLELELEQEWNMHLFRCIEDRL